MATATTPTTSTTLGLLSLCSNLLTYSWALPFYHGPSGPQRITQTAKPRSQAPLLLRRVLRRIHLPRLYGKWFSEGISLL